jgi:hypothetical protein
MLTQPHAARKCPQVVDVDVASNIGTRRVDRKRQCSLLGFQELELKPRSDLLKLEIVNERLEECLR